jgi:hypothetical protein
VQAGRFTSVDPLDRLGAVPFFGYLNYPASMNPYQYAYNNPLRYVDPSGEVVFSGLALAGSMAFGGLAGIAFNIDSQLKENGGNWRCIDLGRVGKAALVGAVGGALTYIVAISAATLMIIGGGSLIPLLYTIACELIINELTYAALLKVDGKFDTYEPSAERIAMSIIFSIFGFNGPPSSVKRSIGAAALDSTDDLAKKQMAFYVTLEIN